MNEVVIGAVAMALAVGALFFFRFWKKTGDRLFAYFAVSFVILAINRGAIVAADPDYREHFYWIRFLAFALILVAILDKNRRPRSRSRDRVEPSSPS